jgi:hypothetical protein
MTRPPLPSRELKYVIQRFAEDPRQEVRLFFFYFFTFFPPMYLLEMGPKQTLSHTSAQ